MSSGTSWLVCDEATALARVTPTALYNARRAGRLPARLGETGRWEFEARPLLEYAADVRERRARAAARAQERSDTESATRTVDAQPLLDFIAARGGPAACGVRRPADLESLRLGRAYGRLTPLTAKRLARRAGARYSDLWPRRSTSYVDAGPLLQQVALRGGPLAVGATETQQKALERAGASGRLTVDQADALAVALLGLTLWDLWPAES